MSAECAKKADDAHCPPARQRAEKRRDRPDVVGGISFGDVLPRDGARRQNPEGDPSLFHKLSTREGPALPSRRANLWSWLSWLRPTEPDHHGCRDWAVVLQHVQLEIQIDIVSVQ